MPSESPPKVVVPAGGFHNGDNVMLACHFVNPPRSSPTQRVDNPPTHPPHSEDSLLKP